MVTFRRRLASKNEYFLLFLVTAFPVHVWAILGFLHTVPSLLLEMNAIQIMSVAAYVIALAFMESSLIFAILFLVSLVLPERFFSSKLIPVGTIWIFFVSIIAASVHLYKTWWPGVIQFVQQAGLWVMVAWIAIGLLAWYGVSQNQKVEKVIQSVAEKLSLLSLIYLCADILGLFVILVRNLA